MPAIRVVALLAAAVAGSAAAQTPAWQDLSLPFERRAADLVGRMTLEEKVSQMMDRAPAIERLGIPEYNWWNEGLHGVAPAGLATGVPHRIREALRRSLGSRAAAAPIRRGGERARPAGELPAALRGRHSRGGCLLVDVCVQPGVRRAGLRQRPAVEDNSAGGVALPRLRRVRLRGHR